jgi:Skp family chaperone for outer membrane proteins
MKKLLLTVMLLSSIAPVLAAGPAPAPQLPQPRIVVIDRQALLQFSKAGQDIERQIEALTTAAKNEFAARTKALQVEGAALQQQVAILSADAKAKKVADFEAKEQATEADAQRRQVQIQNGVAQAQKTMADTLEPIVAQLVQERGANMVLDKTAVVFANTNAFDITKDAITRLDAKLTSIKVSLVNSPAAAAPKQK